MNKDASTPVLRFDKVSVAFDDAVALQDVSFEVFHGGSRIILGAAGSGKTTLLKASLGLVRPQSGRIHLFGHDISRMREEELFDLRSQVGMLFQESALFDSLNVAENVAYPLLNQRAIQCPADQVLPKVKEALQFVELEHTLEKFPSELSGGMRRRAAIARAIVTEPPLLLYDSPTAGLDPITATTIIALIVKKRDLANTTTLMVTHRYQDGHLLANYHYSPANGGLQPARGIGEPAPGRTKFLVLEEGRLVFEGSQSELEASTDPYVAKFVKRTG